MDRQIDRHQLTGSAALCIASRGKNVLQDTEGRKDEEIEAVGRSAPCFVTLWAATQDFSYGPLR